MPLYAGLGATMSVLLALGFSTTLYVIAFVLIKRTTKVET